MNVKLPNPDAFDMGDAFGITEERKLEISNGLNEMAKRIYNGKGSCYVHNVIIEIAELCNTKEELIWAIFLHAKWCQIRGVNLFLF